MRSRTPVQSDFLLDGRGNPSGGKSGGVGITIEWQAGIVSEGGHNGAFLEDVIEAAIQRLEFFNSTRFRCRENSLAITKLEEALHWLDHRTNVREAQGVEDSYETHDEDQIG